MGRFTQLKRNLEQIIFPNRDQHAIPTMDGVLTPNDLLEQFVAVGGGVPDADDVCEGPDGALYLSAGPNIYRFSGPNREQRDIYATFDAPVGGIAFHPDGRILACVSGKGLAAVGDDGSIVWLEAADGEPIHCLTAVAATADGTIYLADGSRQNRSEDWKQDLMEKNHSGRLISSNATLGEARVLLDGLHYPNGLVLSEDGNWLWFSESWNHRLSRMQVGASTADGLEIVNDNLPGYPTRLCRARDGGYWLALLAVRTHLTEFILREDEYRCAMIETLPVEYWPGPALMTTNHCLEPMQIGNVKALGIEKPWAPARSYGLLIRLDQDGQPLDSLHSRRTGQNHGITAVCDTSQGLFAVSKGRGQLLHERQEGSL